MPQCLGLMAIRSGIRAVHLWWQPGCFVVAKRSVWNATVGDAGIWYPKSYNLQSTVSSDCSGHLACSSLYFHVPHFFYFFIVWRRLWLNLGWSSSGGNVRGHVIPDEFTTEDSSIQADLYANLRVFEHRLGHSMTSLNYVWPRRHLCTMSCSATPTVLS